jgi:hypothetical protein
LLSTRIGEGRGECKGWGVLHVKLWEWKVTILLPSSIIHHPSSIIHHQETPKVTHERLRHNSISVIDEPEHIDHGTYRQSIN